MMTKYSFLSILFIFSLYGLSQKEYYSDKYLDSIIGEEILIKKNYKNKSLSEVAQDLKFDGSKELQYAILAKWVVNHLNYDKKSRYISTKSALNQKKGVCGHYSIFMDSLAKYLEFNSNYISGYVKEISNDRLLLVPHAWNAVEINKRMMMSDITWSDRNNVKKSTNATLNRTFFLMEPKKFILTHFPDKKKFRYIKYSYRKFKTTPVISFGYYTLDKYFVVNIKGIKLYNRQSDLKIILKDRKLTDSIEIKKIELVKWEKINKDGYKESEYAIELDKKIDLKKNEIIYSLSASNLDIEKNKNVSISIEYKKMNSTGEKKTYFEEVISFFW